VNDAAPLRVEFWGVRGSFPAPEAGNLGYGGNTACVEVRYGDQPRLILDAGSGLRRLGLALLEEAGGGDRTARIFLSHFHWDHIQGIPSLAPLYRPDWRLVLHSAVPGADLEAMLGRQMRAPYFAAESAIRAQREYRQVCSEGLQAGGLAVRSFPLNHPGGCVGYRIDAPHASLVYATDHEHGDPASDRILREFARDADILICDAQYTPQEYPFRKSWGHSTWLEATRVARDSGVKQLVLFHHDPEHDDQAMARILDQARAEFENTMGAREGWSLTL
jgi:phosphoribosyl 1,2-cyclic phosphodiesterase